MISVLIPVYEVPVPWFVQALDSVNEEVVRFQERHPTLSGCEVVIVCDGSEQTDLLELLSARQANGRERVVHLPENVGVAGALNVGLEECRNELVARFDADDVMLPGRLSAQYERMTRDEEVDCLSTGLNYMVETKDGWAVTPEEVLHPEVVTRAVAAESLWFMNHPTVMYRRSSVMRAGGYDRSLKGFSEDYDLWVRMLLKGMRLRNLRRSYHLLRISNASATKSFNQANYDFLLKTQAKLKS